MPAPRRSLVLLAVACCSAAALCRWWLRRRSLQPRGLAVLVSGCDSGLGYSLALHARSRGLTVFAGVLQPEGEGSRQLRARADAGLRVVRLDVTDERSVREALAFVEAELSREPEMRFHALVNNAGVMVFGEFEWQTSRQVRHQIDVNVIGTMRLTKTFTPLLRKHKGRVVVISSHCARASLPGLSVYGATKSALAGWASALRIELDKFGVAVVQVLPGSFFAHSRLLQRQQEYAVEMTAAMTDEQRNVYEEYFTRFQSYLSPLSASPCLPSPLPDAKLHSVLEEALLAVSPRAVYSHAPLRYRLYHTLFDIAPTTRLRDALVRRFVSLPSWKAT